MCFLGGASASRRSVPAKPDPRATRQSGLHTNAPPTCHCEERVPERRGNLDLHQTHPWILLILVARVVPAFRLLTPRQPAENPRAPATNPLRNSHFPGIRTVPCSAFRISRSVFPRYTHRSTWPSPPGTPKKNFAPYPPTTYNASPLNIPPIHAPFGAE